MSIRLDPSLRGPAPQTQEQPAEAPAGARRASGAEPPAAMEKPRMLATPHASELHPSRHTGPVAKPALFDKEVAALRAAMQAPGPGRLDAAARALAWCASYARRRSRGARRVAAELCDEVGELVPERAELAARLGLVLRAEGELHENSAAATLRACRTLVELLEPGGDA